MKGSRTIRSRSDSQSAVLGPSHGEVAAGVWLLQRHLRRLCRKVVEFLMYVAVAVRVRYLSVPSDLFFPDGSKAKA